MYDCSRRANNLHRIRPRQGAIRRRTVPVRAARHNKRTVPDFPKQKQRETDAARFPLPPALSRPRYATLCSLHATARCQEAAPVRPEIRPTHANRRKTACSLMHRNGTAPPDCVSRTLCLPASEQVFRHAPTRRRSRREQGLQSTPARARIRVRRAPPFRSPMRSAALPDTCSPRVRSVPAHLPHPTVPPDSIPCHRHRKSGRIHRRSRCRSVSASGLRMYVRRRATVRRKP